MTMPKATIYKNDRSVFAQYNIRMPQEVAGDSIYIGNHD